MRNFCGHGAVLTHRAEPLPTLLRSGGVGILPTPLLSTPPSRLMFQKEKGGKQRALYAALGCEVGSHGG